MEVERLTLGPLQANCWLVSDGIGGPLVVIDPAGDASVLLEAIGDRPVAWVVLTHGHFDHLGAAVQVVEATGAPLCVHRADAVMITSTGSEGSGAELFGMDHDSRQADRLLEGGDVVRAGELTLEVLHTPGHTAGGICLLGEGHCFSGDTLFAGSVGRTDLPGGDARALARSIAEKLATLADDTVVHPGHGPDTSIGRERRLNPFFPRA